VNLRNPMRADSIAGHRLDEAAAILRFKKSWPERKAATRKIPFTMLGGAYCFTPAHLATVVRIHEKPPTAEPETRGREARIGRPRARQHPEPQTVTPPRARPRTGPRRAA